MGIVGALRDLGWAAVLACAAFPLALAAQTSLDYWLGDAILIHEFQFGSARGLAADLLHAWLSALPWVAALWVGLKFLRGRLRGAYACAVGGSAAALVLAATAGVLPVPPLVAWLLLATVGCEALARRQRPRAAHA